MGNVGRAAVSSAPSLFTTAGHPIRWALLSELAYSDRHVNELTELLGHPQALVSYHLGRLRESGLVSCRRSSNDGRASYYSVDLNRCADALRASGRSLHPGLTLRSEPPLPTGRPRRRHARVLFACTDNGARSQIAEAVLEQLAGDRIDVFSAGSHPKPIHPNAIKVLAERGIDISDRASKPLSQFEGKHFDVVVTLCDKVREVCPEFATTSQPIHWSLEDPSRAQGSDRATYPVFRSLARELEIRIGYLLALIEAPTTKEATDHARR